MGVLFSKTYDPATGEWESRPVGFTSANKTQRKMAIVVNCEQASDDLKKQQAKFGDKLYYTDKKYNVKEICENEELIVKFPVANDTELVYWIKRLASFLISPIIFSILCITLCSLSYYLTWTYYSREPTNQDTDADGNIPAGKIVTLIPLGPVEDALAAYSSLFSFLLPLYFGMKIDKYQKSRHLYQSLCGNVKAFAMYLAALTEESVKYVGEAEPIKLDGVEMDQLKRRKTDAGHKLDWSPYYDVSINKNFETDLLMARLRYILCALPQTAKYVLRGTSDIAKIDDKYRVKRRSRSSICFGTNRLDRSMCFGKECCKRTGYCGRKNWWLCCRGYIYEPVVEPWSDPDNENILEKDLYQTLYETEKLTMMNHFECLMEIMLGYIKDAEGKLWNENVGMTREFIKCWQKIYDDWGPLDTNSSYEPPTLIRSFFYGSLLIYAVFMPLLKIKYAYYAGLIASLSTLLVFLLLLVIGNTISSPFRSVAGINPTIRADAMQTQMHVYKLLKNMAILDQQKLHGYLARKSKSVFIGDLKKNFQMRNVGWSFKQATRAPRTSLGKTKLNRVLVNGQTIELLEGTPPPYAIRVRSEKSNDDEEKLEEAEQRRQEQVLEEIKKSKKEIKKSKSS